MIRWTHIALLLFLFPSPSLFSLHHFSLQCCERRRWHDSLLPTENLLHRKRGERERLGSLVRHLSSQANHLQPRGNRWGCKAPLATESPSPSRFSGWPISHIIQPDNIFSLWCSSISLTHDTGDFCLLTREKTTIIMTLNVLSWHLIIAVVTI